jgi:hypothetical protein
MLVFSVLSLQITDVPYRRLFHDWYCENNGKATKKVTVLEWDKLSSDDHKVLPILPVLYGAN